MARSSVVVGAAGVRYSCPTVASVDLHIAGLLRKIEQNPPRFPRLATLWRTDIDALLDRRNQLVEKVPA